MSLVLSIKFSLCTTSIMVSSNAPRKASPGHVLLSNYTSGGLYSFVAWKPPTWNFLDHVTMSGLTSSPQCWCAQSFPVAPRPVCTSSQIKAASFSLVILNTSEKKLSDASRSPPSAGIGSTMTPAMSFSLTILANCSRQLFSSLLLCDSLSSRGYLSWGKGAINHGKAGNETLWCGLDRVRDKVPIVLPWKPPLKLTIFSAEPLLFRTSFMSVCDQSCPYFFR